MARIGAEWRAHNTGAQRIRSTSFPGFPPLPREITLVAAGHVAPKMWEPTRIYLMGGVVKYKIVAVVIKDTKYNGELAS